MAVATIRMPTARPIGPVTRAKIAPRRPVPGAIPRAERLSASPPTTALISPAAAPAVATIRFVVSVPGLTAGGPEACATVEAARPTQAIIVAASTNLWIRSRRGHAGIWRLLIRR